MLIFRIFWWSWWVMFWGIILFLLFGCTTTSIEKEYRMVREMRDADCQPQVVKVSWERQTFELMCK